MAKAEVSSITKAMCRKLPLQNRLAFGAHLCEQILQQYSAYFLKEYEGLKYVTAAWKFIDTGKPPQRLIREAYRIDLDDEEGDAAIERMEQEGYDRWEVFLPQLLMAEIKEQDGGKVDLIAEFACSTFRTLVAYRLGVSAADVSFRKQQAAGEQIEKIAFAWTLQVFEAAKSLAPKQLSKAAFAHLPMPNPADRSQVPEAILAALKSRRKKWLPPLHERPAKP